MHPRHRLAAAALCTDLGLYLLMLSLPYRLLDASASSAVLGTVPFLYAGPYALVALFAGRFSDRFPRRAPIRAGTALAVAAAAGLSAVDSTPWILALVPCLGIGLGFFWPSLQAGFSEVSHGHDLHRLTGLFNVSWSIGKGLGLVGGGWLLVSIGASGTSIAAALAFATSFAVLPGMPRPGDHAEALAADADAPPPDVQRAFRRAAWIANGMAFGVAATINHHLPKLLLPHGLGAREVGLFLGLVFLAQTVLFVTIGPRRGWHFRALPLIALQGVLALVTLALTFVADFTVLLFLAPLIGLTLGFSYQSSLYYSLHAPVDRGAQAGVHEAALGSASAIVPVLGGLAVASTGATAPFVVAAVVIAGSAIFGATTILRTRRRPPR